MKRPIILLVLLFTVPAFAKTKEESVAKAEAADAASPANGFHWILRKCVVEENDEIETTPGSPPLTIDDPATPGCNNWEINLVVDGDLTTSEKAWNFPLVDINYGVGGNLQLKYEVPNTVLDNQDGRATAIGNSKVGVKYQFYGDDESKLQLAVYPQIEFATPGKSANSQLPESQGSETTLPFLLSRRVGTLARGNVMMSLNLAFNFSSRADTANSVLAAAAVGAPLFQKVSIMAEVATEQAVRTVGDDPRAQLVKMNIGFMGPVSKHLGAFGSFGRSLVSSDQKEHTYVLAGLRVLLGD
jgi:hypothetical protein